MILREKNITPVSFLKGKKKVLFKQEANFVKFLTKDGFLFLRKDHIKDWENIPQVLT